MNYKDIIAYEGLYETNEFGYVRTKNIISSSVRGSTRLTKSKPFSPKKDADGRRYVRLVKDAKAKESLYLRLGCPGV
jgi:hypothetical protein